MSNTACSTDASMNRHGSREGDFSASCFFERTEEELDVPVPQVVEQIVGALQGCNSRSSDKQVESLRQRRTL